MNQRGFVWLPILLQAAPYIAGALAFWGAFEYVDSNWEPDAGIARGRAEALAEVEPLLAACRLQELAVSDMVKEGEARKARATDALKSAREGTQKARTEAERLRGLAAAPETLQVCPAGQAVAEIRRGLRSL